MRPVTHRRQALLAASALAASIALPGLVFAQQSNNTVEELIEEALYPYPKGLVIATKGGFLRTGPNQWHVNSRPEHLKEALEGSLARLNVNRIDLYQLHRIDPTIPFEKTLEFLQGVQEEGLVKHIGLSEVGVEEIKKAGLYDKLFQCFALMTGAYSTAVKGDERAFAEVVGIRAYESVDVMTSEWADLPHDVLKKISSRIVNEVPEISRVVYDITTKPPATMEWE